MPARQRRTWQEWSVPPDAPIEPLLTTQGLLDALRGAGFDVPRRTLRHWQIIGRVPSPMRRWHNGATRALYPQWIVPTICEIARQHRLRGRIACTCPNCGHDFLVPKNPNKDV